MLRVLKNNSLTAKTRSSIRQFISTYASAYLSAKGYVLARKMFNHALWGFGNRLPSSTYKLMIKKFKKSSDFRKKVRQNRNSRKTQSIEFKRGDLYYAIQHMNYAVRNTKKVGKKYSVKVFAWDRYNFDNIRKPLNAFANAANNLGYLLERSGVSYAYFWGVSFKMKV